MRRRRTFRNIIHKNYKTKFVHNVFVYMYFTNATTHPHIRVCVYMGWFSTDAYIQRTNVVECDYLCAFQLAHMRRARVAQLLLRGAHKIHKHTQ